MGFNKFCTLNKLVYFHHKSVIFDEMLARYFQAKDCEYKLRLFLSFAPQLDVEEVPDPYYGGPKGFENVLDLIEEASKALLMDIKNHHLNNS